MYVFFLLKKKKTVVKVIWELKAFKIYIWTWKADKMLVQSS